MLFSAFSNPDSDFQATLTRPLNTKLSNKKINNLNHAWSKNSSENWHGLKHLPSPD